MNRAKKIAFPLLVIAAGVGVAVVMVKTREEVQPQPAEIPLPLVEVAPLQLQDHRFLLRAQGTVVAPTEINLVTEVAGQVVSVAPTFTEGGFFTQGEVLVRIDPRDYTVALAAAQAKLAEAEVGLQREQAEADIARKEWQRLGEGQPSPLLVREPQLAQARAAIESARANLRKAQLDLDRCEIQAPFDGRVRTKRADVGQFLNRGETVARVYSVAYAEVPLPLPLDDVAYATLPVGYRSESQAREGPPVILKARLGAHEARWEGRIVRTVGEIDPRTRMLTAVARVEDPYGRRPDWDNAPLALGLFVEAEIEGRTVRDVYLAPRNAFRNDGALKVVGPDNTLRLRSVERLRVEGDQVVFRAELEPSERAVITLMDAATDGMRVRVIQEDAATPAGGGA